MVWYLDRAWKNRSSWVCDNMHWIGTSGILDTPTLVVLTNSKLHLVDDEQSKIEQLAREIETGVPPEILLQKKGKAIFLEKVTVISADEKKKSIAVKWLSHSLTSNHGTEEESIDFPVASDRDQLFYALKDTFGDKSRFMRKEFTRLRAVVTPLCWCLVIIGVAWFIIYASAHLDESEGRTHRVKAKIFVFLLSRLVALLGVGGVKIAVFVVALLLIYFAGRDLGERIKNPPIMLTLKPKSWKPTSPK